MTLAEVIRAAWPGATDDDADYVIWNRTAFPFRVSVRDTYRAACRVRRAAAHGVRLCDFCDNRVTVDWTCQKCRNALDSAKGSK